MCVTLNKGGDSQSFLRPGIEVGITFEQQNL